MKRLVLAASMLGCSLMAGAADDIAAVASEIRQLNEKVKGFEAILEIQDQRGDENVVATSTLTVSKDYGWKIENELEGGGRVITLNDFNYSVQYYPAAKRALRLKADNDILKSLFRKPAEDMNPVELLDAASLKLVGEEEFEGVPVWRIEGTTQTQVLPGMEPVQRRIEAWISRTDGLPRKTIEYADESFATTIYHDLRVNPQLSQDDFTFTPAEGVEVIDGDSAFDALDAATEPGPDASQPPADARNTQTPQ